MDSTAPADTPKEEKSSFEQEPENEVADSTEATQITTAAGSEHSEEEHVSKFMLLDRLFRFLSQEDDDEPVNPVLAGYFSKVVCLLINRKQKQIVPYIVDDANKVVENLLKHVYSRSVAEVVHRLLHIVESNFEEELSVKIAEKKQIIMASLIDQLNCTKENETDLNAAFILQDMMEQKPFFQILTKRQNMQKMYDIAFSPDGAADLQSKVTTQGLIARFVQQFNDRQKQDHDEDRWDNSGEDDDIIVNEVSDEENEDSKTNANAIIEQFMVQMVEPLKKILDMAPLESVSSQLSTGRILPLGNTKLRAVELLQSIVSLKKAAIITAVKDSGVMKTVLQLIERHPWNNMIQLKVHLIYQDVFNSEIEVADKLDFLRETEVTTALAKMAETPEVKFSSGNLIRNGFMGFVIQLGNLICKQKAANGTMETLEG